MTMNTKAIPEQGWTQAKPTTPGAYWVRGNSLTADALVQVKLEQGALWCNLHMRTTEPDFGCGYAVERLSEKFEWLGPLVAPQPPAGPAARKVFIVWNEQAEDGVVFADRSDARYAATGQSAPGSFGDSTLGYTFRDVYADDEPDTRFPIIAVTLPAVGGEA